MDDPKKSAPKLSAGLLSQGKMAIRGLASLVKSRPPHAPATTTPADVVSPDTLREQRIPPGQVQTKRWPVLHAGPTPTIDLKSWSLRLGGLVENPLTLTWDQLRQMPSSRVYADMHCVTRWSMLDNLWEGVRVAELARMVAIKPAAKFVIARAEHGFTTNLPIADLLAEDCLVAWSHNGQPLEPDHGWPLRLIVPKLYAWKSAKWLRELDFVEHDVPGFWEENGYHAHGDPWTEERFW